MFPYSLASFRKLTPKRLANIQVSLSNTQRYPSRKNTKPTQLCTDSRLCMHACSAHTRKIWKKNTQRYNFRVYKKRNETEKRRIKTYIKWNKRTSRKTSYLVAVSIFVHRVSKHEANGRCFIYSSRLFSDFTFILYFEREKIRYIVCDATYVGVSYMPARFCFV